MVMVSFVLSTTFRSSASCATAVPSGRSFANQVRFVVAMVFSILRQPSVASRFVSADAQRDTPGMHLFGQ
ncbi:hypothetical protein EAH85_14195 [Curtobacterium flaccumfaciens]|nr:hypothetical protein EAH85_14195 [Curtobacterium flaccumfaciens]